MALMPLTDFVQHAPVEPEVIEAYRGRVPDEMIELWETYGYGSFAEGYIRVIDPREYEAGVGDLLGKTTGRRLSIPLFVTGFADIIAWEEPDMLIEIRFRSGETRGVGSKISTMTDIIALDGVEELDDNFDWKLFPEAVAAHGPLAHDESFGFVPYLSLGGPKRVENLHPRKTIEAIAVMVEFQGPIEH